MAKKMDRIVSAVCDGYLGAVHRFVFGVDCEDTREMGETDNITEANWQTFSKGALWAQLKGSQSALTKALGELTETRAELNAAQAIVLQDAAERAETAALRAELEQARAERDAAEKHRRTVVGYCDQVQQRERRFVDRYFASRLTIAALVVVVRAAIRGLRHTAATQARWQMALLALKVNMLLVREQANQAGE